MYLPFVKVKSRVNSYGVVQTPGVSLPKVFALPYKLSIIAGFEIEDKD